MHDVRPALTRRTKIIWIAAAVIAAAAVLDWARPPARQASVSLYEAAVIKPYRLFLRPMSSHFIRCPYRPTCSQYSTEAMRAYGFPIGAWMTTKRLFRCMPWVPYGTRDPVPPPHAKGSARFTAFVEAERDSGS